ncbi:MAG: hypothetical protein ACK4PN_04995 [Allorhizobium sp.]
MRFLVRTLLVLAALAYGAMPLTGMATAVSAPADPATVAMATEAATTAPAVHHGAGHAVHDGGKMAASSAYGPADTDCPHPGKSDRSPHCAACLTLPAELQMAKPGRPPRSPEVPAVLATLLSWPAAPLDPPPRV